MSPCHPFALSPSVASPSPTNPVRKSRNSQPSGTPRVSRAVCTVASINATESTLPYLEEDDAIFYVEKRTAKDGKPYQVNTLVAKFVARITREINTEDGDTLFHVCAP